MKVNKFYVIIFVLLLMTSAFVIAYYCLNERRVDFYYNPKCSHCIEIYPLVLEYSQKFNQWDFNFLDVTKNNYDFVSFVPLVVVYTEDGREIRLEGSGEIKKYLKCELQEQTTKECPTHTNLIRGSYFIEK